jgi:hypothetical protein
VTTDFTSAARRLGLFAAATTAVLIVAYAVTLTVGFLSLKSPNDPIGEPMFSILEVLIILMMPAMVALMVAVHAWAPTRLKVLSLTALSFMGLLAGVTCSLHFVILTVSHQAAFVGQSWLTLVFQFRWPSVAYALDILAWDVFFPLSMLCAAALFGGSSLQRWIRWLMVASALLALGGLSGVAANDMQLRNIGIVGYVGVFLVVDVLLGVLFYRAAPQVA